MLSLYSLIWTFLISCPMLLLIFILRRRSDYLTKYGVTFISILYIFCTVRMLFPIEFPSHQEVICDPYLFSSIMKVYADLGPSGRICYSGYLDSWKYNLFPSQKQRVE